MENAHIMLEMAEKCSNYAKNWGLCFFFWIILCEADYAKNYASILYQHISACSSTKLSDSTDKSPFSQSSATVTSSTRNLPSEPELHILPSVCVPKPTVTPLSLDEFLLCEQKRITDLTLLCECAVSVSVSVSDFYILPGKVHQTKSTLRTPTKLWGTVKAGPPLIWGFDHFWLFAPSYRRSREASSVKIS